MSGALSALLDRIQADATLRPEFQEACRKGYVLAEGRRVRFVATEREKGHWEVTPVVEPKYEPIPSEDWSDLSLDYREGEWRLEGWREWPAEPAHEPKEWRFVRFRPNQPLVAALKRCVDRKGKKEALPARDHGLRSRLTNWYRDEYVGGEGWSQFVNSDRAAPSAKDDLKAARKKFGSRVSREMIRQIRREHAPSKWTRPGPRAGQ
jgi:hypothetical protein